MESVLSAHTNVWLVAIIAPLTAKPAQASTEILLPTVSV